MDMTLLPVLLGGAALAAILFMGSDDDDDNSNDNDDSSNDNDDSSPVVGETFDGTDAAAQSFTGTAGDDIFNVGTGDTVTGGDGDDLFTYVVGNSLSFNAETPPVTITDFNADDDMLAIQQGSISLISSVEYQDDGEGNVDVVTPNLMIAGSPQKLFTLEGVAVEDLEDVEVDFTSA